MRTSLRALTLPFATISVLTFVIGLAYAAQASSAAPAAAQYATYNNDRWHFSLAVPADMTVGAYDQAGDGQTMQFMDASGEYKFQVSAWPYTQLDVTLGRLGDPSTTADQPDHLEIVDVVRDDTFTVLFQKNGIRYAVVTLPEQEAWLTDILTNWQFTD